MGTLHTYITQQNRKPDSMFSISARFNTEKKKGERLKETEAKVGFGV